MHQKKSARRVLHKNGAKVDQGQRARLHAGPGLVASWCGTGGSIRISWKPWSTSSPAGKLPRRSPLLPEKPPLWKWVIEWKWNEFISMFQIREKNKKNTKVIVLTTWQMHSNRPDRLFLCKERILVSSSDNFNSSNVICIVHKEITVCPPLIFSEFCFIPWFQFFFMQDLHFAEKSCNLYWNMSMLVNCTHWP